MDNCLRNSIFFICNSILYLLVILFPDSTHEHICLFIIIYLLIILPFVLRLLFPPPLYRNLLLFLSVCFCIYLPACPSLYFSSYSPVFVSLPCPSLGVFQLFFSNLCSWISQSICLHSTPLIILFLLWFTFTYATSHCFCASLLYQYLWISIFCLLWFSLRIVHPNFHVPQCLYIYFLPVSLSVLLTIYLSLPYLPILYSEVKHNTSSHLFPFILLNITTFLCTKSFPATFLFTLSFLALSPESCSATSNILRFCAFVLSPWSCVDSLPVFVFAAPLSLCIFERERRMGVRESLMDWWVRSKSEGFKW